MTLGGSLAASTTAPPPAEARLQARLQAVHQFLAAGGAERCDLPRLDAAKLAAVADTLRGRPAVLRGLWRNDLWTKDRFLRKFTSHRVKTNNGHFDHLRSKEVLSMEQYLAQNASEWNVFFADMAYSVHREFWNMLGSAAEPAPLLGFDARPILSIGTQASSTRAHSHAETWQLLLGGLKAWWLAKPGSDLDKLLGADPCVALAGLEGLTGRTKKVTQLGKEPWFCVQRPGEAMYFGDRFPHATCNLAPFVLGFGAQGRSQNWASALHIAAHRNNRSGLQELIEIGGIDLDAVDEDGATALHRSVARGHRDSAALLVAAGCDLRLRDREGKNAAAMAAERGDLPLLELLAEAGTPIKQKDGGKPHAIHWAALSGHQLVLEYLLKRRASAHAQDSGGIQPVHYAALESDVQTVAFLVEHQRANISATGHAGEQPLHWAAGVGHRVIVEYLLRARADPNAADQRGTTALHFAAAQDRLEAARQLLAASASIAASAAGVQPLHAAAAKGHMRLVSLLLQAGADAKARDRQRRVPADVASNQMVVDLLRSQEHFDDL
ncbi:ANK3 [Symbiodinium natans]|uniref:ANK3 protein n=1 Tax=Symbiodinium natans TaxID=878477 RepID=A0A812Q2P1_9DINO|nr:ANK3 [Symbiodinium natans]